MFALPSCRRSPIVRSILLLRRNPNRLGEDDRAIEYLEKSYEERSHWLVYLHIDPSMDGLRYNSRFQNLLQRVGLPFHHAIPT